jgi:ADP-ribose pyrophosphatase
VSQNTSGSYPILVITFLCKASGKLLKESDESQNIRWMPVSTLAQLLDDDASQFYPMHIYALKKYLQLT